MLQCRGETVRSYDAMIRLLRSNFLFLLFYPISGTFLSEVLRWKSSHHPTLRSHDLLLSNGCREVRSSQVALQTLLHIPSAVSLSFYKECHYLECNS